MNYGTDAGLHNHITILSNGSERGKSLERHRFTLYAENLLTCRGREKSLTLIFVSFERRTVKGVHACTLCPGCVWSALWTLVCSLCSHPATWPLRRFTPHPTFSDFAVCCVACVEELPSPHPVSTPPRFPELSSESVVRGELTLTHFWLAFVWRALLFLLA